MCDEVETGQTHWSPSAPKRCRKTIPNLRAVTKLRSTWDTWGPKSWFPLSPCHCDRSCTWTQASRCLTVAGQTDLPCRGALQQHSFLGTTQTSCVCEDGAGRGSESKENLVYSTFTLNKSTVPSSNVLHWYLLQSDKMLQHDIIHLSVYLYMTKSSWYGSCIKRHRNM